MPTTAKGGMAVIAHRGASAYAPEHTAAAYDLALQQGADVLELDVRTLADGTPVVVHDATLARTCGDPRAVADLRERDLDALDPATRPLTLDAVLARYGRGTRYLVELKEPSHDDALRTLETIDAHGLRGEVALQSFDHAALRRLRELDRDLPLQPLYRSWVPARWVRTDLARVAAWATSVGACVPAVDAALVPAARARGLGVHVYTVNDEREMRRLAGLGVDGLITDVPDRVRGLASLPSAA